MSTTNSVADVVIKFAGDSGDGMQLTGTQFTDNTALVGNDFATFPNFPAEIRAPQGTLAGVSGFQIHFGSREINTAGDYYDVLVAMNAAALKDSIGLLKKGGILIVDESGFDSKNLRLAGYAPDTDLLRKEQWEDYDFHPMAITKMTKETLIDSELEAKSKDRAKNMFVLGFLYWLYNRDLSSTISFIEKKFAQKVLVKEANVKVLQAGFHFGETMESIRGTFTIDPAPLPKGNYRNISGNQAIAIGLIAASKKAALDLFYGSYPITPASDVLHELSRKKQYGVKTFQAEDEIAAVSAAIGASFGGGLGVTGTSGPGLALKSEAINLAMMLELPLVVVNVQRAGPSTGMPTKTEQSDLLFAMYGRNGESPIPIIAASTPSDCFHMAYEATRIAIEHMTPVIFLSDGYLGNGSEPWKYPQFEDLQAITPSKVSATDLPYLPYKRDEKLVRKWAVPGEAGFEHRVGGLEKEEDTGNVSYNPENHEKMVHTRAAKLEMIANYIPDQTLDCGEENGDVLLIGWGSTYGSIRSAMSNLLEEGHKVGYAHLKYIAPFPKNLGDMISSYKKVIVPEINNGQLVKVLREKYAIDAISFAKVKGLPLYSSEITEFTKKIIAE